MRNNERKENFFVPKNFFEKKEGYVNEVLHEDKDSMSILRNGLSAFLA